MATTYKTPGVYVEEIPKFPPSIAQVETAIPAFIGYTQMAQDLAAGDLNKVPKRIGSLVEYEQYYGYGPSPDVKEVKINDANKFVSATVNNIFYLYDSLRMFYANGGGDCFIVSVGDYSSTLAEEAFKNGFAEIAKISEPTILLYPDAVALEDTKLGNVQVAALSQCQDLQDRVTVMDVKENDPLCNNFKNNVGVNYLSYGAAYTPWLKVNLPKNVTYNDVKDVIKRSGVKQTLVELTGDVTFQNKTAELILAYSDAASIAAKTRTLCSPDTGLKSHFTALCAATQNPANLKLVFLYCYNVAAQIDRFVKSTGGETLKLAGLQADVVAAITSDFNAAYQNVVGLEKEVVGNGGYTVTAAAILTAAFTVAAWAGVTGADATKLLPVAPATDNDRLVDCYKKLETFFDTICIAYEDLVSTAAQKCIMALDTDLVQGFPIQYTIAKLNQVYADIANIEGKIQTLGIPTSTLRDKFNALCGDFTAATGNSDANLQKIFTFYYAIATQIDNFIKAGNPSELTLAALKTDVIAAVISNFNPSFMKVVGIEKEIKNREPVFPASTPSNIFLESCWAGVSDAAMSGHIPPAVTVDEEKRQYMFNSLVPLFEELNQAFLTLVYGSAKKYAEVLDDTLALTFPLYNSILSGVCSSMTTMPPSGAVVGVYAAIDRTRGVWKAPANVSLTNVISPTVIFTKSELDNLNVNSDTGKSINAIRAFVGKGTLVYGARTLAGNDNEWRYISVRRFFNMVEESSKNATQTFVFEPNDANTWVKVQAMLENFLTTLWRQGALQGIKPEQAFYVAVGLGKTMTALDILEGRMIVEIGMAVVRPAEFIILRFSHKMAES